MHLNDFYTNTKRMTTWFRKKMDADQLDLMFGQLKHIPSEAYADIVDGIISDSRYFPTINEIKNRHASWRSAHPEKVIAFEKTECRDCRGTGLLFFTAPDPETKKEYQVVCRCGACRNWLRHYPPSTEVAIFYRNEIERRFGAEKVVPDLSLYEKQPPKTNLSAMVEGVAEEVPF